MDKVFIINGKEISVQNFQQDHQEVSFYLNGKKYFYKLISKNKNRLTLERGLRLQAFVEQGSPSQDVMVIAGGVESFISSEKKDIRSSSTKEGGLISPMPGKIFKVVKEVGSKVKKGETILILEAMKMEHAMKADKDGIVKKINFKVGDLVSGGVSLAEVEE